MTTTAQTMQVDLVTANGIQASAFITGPVWAANQSAIQGLAQEKGFQLNSYVAAPSDNGLGYQTLSTYAQVSAGIADTGQYVGASSLVDTPSGSSSAAAASPAAAATSVSRATIALATAGIGALGVLVWLLLRSR